MRRLVLAAMAMAAVALTGCASSGSTGSTTAPSSSSAPAEQPAPASTGSSWTTPQYPAAPAAARAAGCDIVADGSGGPGAVNCTMPDPSSPSLGEIRIAVFTSPAAEQQSADAARQLAGQAGSGDIYLVQGRGWTATCTDLGNACRSVQARIGGTFTHYTLQGSSGS
jgi:hypothetical protein